jgi:transcription antitermination factor NusG
LESNLPYLNRIVYMIQTKLETEIPDDLKKDIEYALHDYGTACCRTSTQERDYWRNARLQHILAIGDRVRVLTGNFQDKEGVITELNTKNGEPLYLVVVDGGGVALKRARNLKAIGGLSSEKDTRCTKES